MSVNIGRPKGVEPRDSAGMTEKQREAFEKNVLPVPRLSVADRDYADEIRVKCAEYPRILYTAAKWKIDDEGDKVYIDGDKVAPGYHAYEEHRKGRAIQIFERHPFRTMTVDNAEEEAEAIGKGWFRTPAEVGIGKQVKRIKAN